MHPRRPRERYTHAVRCQRNLRALLPSRQVGLSEGIHYEAPLCHTRSMEEPHSAPHAAKRGHSKATNSSSPLLERGLRSQAVSHRPQQAAHLRSRVGADVDDWVFIVIDRHGPADFHELGRALHTAEVHVRIVRLTTALQPVVPIVAPIAPRPQVLG